MEFVRHLAHDPASPLLFNSGTFFLCYTLILAGYALLLPGRWPRTIYVYLFSLYYYYRCNGLFVVALLATTIADFLLALRLEREPRPGWRKAIVAASVLLNLGILGYFKYTNFLLENFALLRGQPAPRFDIFLPIGISFYTFQSLSYVIDVYRRELRPTHQLLDYAFYLAFFPQIVAGPIVRARDLLPQIANRPTVGRDDVGEGLFLIVRGLLKFAIWGGLHGLALVAEKRFRSRRPLPMSEPPRWRRALGWVVTFHFVCGCWIFFRSPDFATTQEVLGQLATIVQSTAELRTVYEVRHTLLLVVVASLAMCFFPKRAMVRLASAFRDAPALAKAATVLLVIQSMVQLELLDVQPFIYFQF